jgi:hypothetical protein
MLRILYHGTKIELNSRNSVLNHSAEEKTTRMSIPLNKKRNKHLEFRSEPFRRREKQLGIPFCGTKIEANSRNPVPKQSVWRIRNVYPGSRIRTVSIPDPRSRVPDPGSSSKNLSILTPKKAKKWFLSSIKYDPGCSSRIPDPGVKKAPNPGSRIRIRNTDSILWTKTRFLFCLLEQDFFKTNFFMQFRSVLSFGIDSSVILGMPRNEHFLPRNTGNCVESIPRNFFGTKFSCQPYFQLSTTSHPSLCTFLFFLYWYCL